jgi:hypothetical protein
MRTRFNFRLNLENYLEKLQRNFFPKRKPVPTTLKKNEDDRKERIIHFSGQEYPLTNRINWMRRIPKIGKKYVKRFFDYETLYEVDNITTRTKNAKADYINEKLRNDISKINSHSRYTKITPLFLKGRHNNNLLIRKLWGRTPTKFFENTHFYPANRKIQKFDKDLSRIQKMKPKLSFSRLYHTVKWIQHKFEIGFASARNCWKNLVHFKALESNSKLKYSEKYIYPNFRFRNISHYGLARI